MLNFFHFTPRLWTLLYWQKFFFCVTFLAFLNVFLVCIFFCILHENELFTVVLLLKLMVKFNNTELVVDNYSTFHSDKKFIQVHEKLYYFPFQINKLWVYCGKTVWITLSYDRWLTRQCKMLSLLILHTHIM